MLMATKQKESTKRAAETRRINKARDEMALVKAHTPEQEAALQDALDARGAAQPPTPRASTRTSRTAWIVAVAMLAAVAALVWFATRV